MCSFFLVHYKLNKPQNKHFHHMPPKTSNRTIHKWLALNWTQGVGPVSSTFRCGTLTHPYERNMATILYNIL